MQSLKTCSKFKPTKCVLMHNSLQELSKVLNLNLMKMCSNVTFSLNAFKSFNMCSKFKCIKTCSNVIFSLGAFKSFGEKTASLFERKKKDAGDLAAQKVQEASAIVEGQAQKAGELIQSTKSDAEKAAVGAVTSGKLYF